MGKVQDVPVGFLGLGEVGRPVLRRLKEQGAAIHATSRSPALRYKMARDTIDLCSTPDEINSKIKDGIIVLMLSKQSLIDAFLTGDDGLLANLTPGALIVDLGQTSADTTRLLATQVSEKGAHWLDAPALGSEQEALNGNLTIRAGGRAVDFARALPLLETLSQDIKHLGDIGAGQEAITAA
jgi:3-hydroxyisobutyrate dehydrogenase-like beta-hydroxyacid dehydrogenase